MKYIVSSIFLLGVILSALMLVAALVVALLHHIDHGGWSCSQDGGRVKCESAPPPLEPY